MHPFSFLTLRAQRRAFVIVLVLTFAVWIPLILFDSPLRTEAAPNGIVSFELAGEITAARAMVDSWDERARIFAALSLGLDYLFLFLWTGSVALGCVLMSHHVGLRSPRLERIGVSIAWAALVAAALDATENFGLAQVLLGSHDPFWPALARACAIPKFGVLFAGLAYVAAAPLLARVAARRKIA